MAILRKSKNLFVTIAESTKTRSKIVYENTHVSKIKRSIELMKIFRSSSIKTSKLFFFRIRTYIVTLFNTSRGLFNPSPLSF